jgi:exopolysaccharide biosynthesis polyprenyl glycosylphosphotransferase
MSSEAVPAARLDPEPPRHDLNERRTGVRSALALRTELTGRGPFAVRRHAKRLAARCVVLVAADVLALGLARVAVGPIAFAIPDNWRLARLTTSPLLAPMPAALVVAAVFVFGLLLTGSYSRVRRLNYALRIVGGCVLGVSVVGFRWFQPAYGAIPALLASAFLAAGFIVLLRRPAERFLARVWPRDRGAAPAVFLGTEQSVQSPPARAVTAAGGDYRRAAQVIMREVGSDDALVHELDRCIKEQRGEAVVLCEPLSRRTGERVLDIARDHACQVLYPARVVRLDSVRPRLVWHYDQPFFELGAPMLKPTALVLKRSTDVVGSGLLLLVAMPVMALIALAIKLDSPGNVLFTQDRAGLGGRRLRMYKFRTMREGADLDKSELAHLNHTGDVRLFKIPSDPRVTRLGSFLRRWSLDELPQLWNVLRGDMSLVGPRPFFESDFIAYEDRHFRRLDAKPGITGLWQVSGRSEILDFEDVVFLDRQYIEQWSLWLDVSILFRTVPAVMRRTGAY